MDDQLDLSIDFENHGTVQDSFDRIANELMNKWVLACGENEYGITELEFYLHHPKHHPDPYVHCDQRQQTSHKWYVHRSGRGGVDITFGNDGFYGGILLRSMVNIKTCEYVNGPKNLIDKIVTECNTSYGNAQTQFFNNEVYDNEFLKLSKCKITQNFDHVNGPRIGINNFTHNNWQEFRFKTYRFFSSFNEVKKSKEKYLFILSYLYRNHQIIAYQNFVQNNNSYQQANCQIRICFDRSSLKNHIESFFEGYNCLNSQEIDIIINNSQRSVNDMSKLFGHLMRKQEEQKKKEESEND